MTLYARWVKANGPAAVAAIVAGTLLEGVFLGVLQVRVLRQILPHLPERDWIVATAVGAGLAWTLGMVPSTVMGLLTSGAAASPPAAEPSAALQVALAVALGACLGPFLGVPQGRVLRRHGGALGTWVWANVAAWAVGMPIIFAGMSTLPALPSVSRLLGTIAVACLGAGLVVGAIHGRVLLRMFPGDHRA
jgi:hypothetical protein